MSNYKRQVFGQLVDEVRRSQEATARFDEAVADALGLNPTDMRCLGVIEREGPMAAGRLAEATGLTTGAMTVALDRLEGAGYVQRVRDTADRRRVMVQITDQASAKAERFYAEHLAHAERLFHSYSTQQLELLLEFVREGREFNEQQAEQLERQNRRREGSPDTHDLPRPGA